MANVVTIICPSLKCRRALQVPEHVRGQLVRCKHCGTTFLVPKARKTASAVVETEEDEEKA
jgi:hypothetical protein